MGGDVTKQDTDDIRASVRKNVWAIGLALLIAIPLITSLIGAKLEAIDTNAKGVVKNETRLDGHDAALEDVRAELRNLATENTQSHGEIRALILQLIQESK